MKYARAKRAKLLFFTVKYANLSSSWLLKLPNVKQQVDKWMDGRTEKWREREKDGSIERQIDRLLVNLVHFAGEKSVVKPTINA